MEKPFLDPTDPQGGKAYGILMTEREKKLDEINQEFLSDDSYKDVDDLEKKLDEYKTKFLDFDLDVSGDINYLALKRMMEKLGKPKTHRELMKMINEVDTTGSETISYREFLLMMLGSQSSVLKLILLFESMANEKPEVPKGPPPTRRLESLP